MVARHQDKTTCVVLPVLSVIDSSTSTGLNRLSNLIQMTSDNISLLTPYKGPDLLLQDLPALSDSTLARALKRYF